MRTVELQRQWEAQVFLFIASVFTQSSWGKDRGVLGAALVLIFLLVMSGSLFLSIWVSVLISLSSKPGSC